MEGLLSTGPTPSSTLLYIDAPNRIPFFVKVNRHELVGCFEIASVFLLNAFVSMLNAFVSTFLLIFRLCNKVVAALNSAQTGCKERLSTAQYHAVKVSSIKRIKV